MIGSDRDCQDNISVMLSQTILKPPPLISRPHLKIQWIFVKSDATLSIYCLPCEACSFETFRSHSIWTGIVTLINLQYFTSNSNDADFSSKTFSRRTDGHSASIKTLSSLKAVILPISLPIFNYSIPTAYCINSSHIWRCPPNLLYSIPSSVKNYIAISTFHPREPTPPIHLPLSNAVHSGGRAPAADATLNHVGNI